MLKELDSKLIALKEDPEKFGVYLSGRLHGYKSVRLVKKWRLIFSLDSKEKVVYLVALDHRGDVYD